VNLRNWHFLFCRSRTPRQQRLFDISWHFGSGWSCQESSGHDVWQWHLDNCYRWSQSRDDHGRI